MPKNESKVTRDVREKVIQTASKIQRLRAKFNKKSAPVKQRIKNTEKEFVKEISRKGRKLRTEAKRLSRKAIKTTKDAIKGFKEGVEIVRNGKTQVRR
ncbi:MAG: hypothetical protein A2293_03355 [Elusimicrobia bacterium RIFOXYB2_FULL_49_7]|nr:MAG: hypothetical protein A2293_03355 [Elusimicrobia bacterium RIFOXYB2_FULL_49_7]